MAEIQYQNPNSANVSAQLESRLRGVALDGATELRREVISTPEVVDLLERILKAIEDLPLHFSSALR